MGEGLCYVGFANSPNPHPPWPLIRASDTSISVSARLERHSGVIRVLENR